MNLSKQALLEKCEELGIKKCKSKNKSELIELINQHTQNANIPIEPNEQIQNNITYPPFHFIDLFCGIGGFHQGTILCLRRRDLCRFLRDLEPRELLLLRR